jgi:hypothetical protein
VEGCCECGNEFFWLHKMQGISRVAEDVLASVE